MGVVAGGVVGRRSQNRQWLQQSRTAAYEKFLQAFGAVEMELRGAYVDRRVPAIDWEPFNAALQSMSLVASEGAMTAADQICDLIEEFTILFHGRQPSDLDELRPIHAGLHEAHVRFVNAARRSLDPSQGYLVRALGGPSPWHGVESSWTRGDGSLGSERGNASCRDATEATAPDGLQQSDSSTAA
ncbi:hypothetical protein [Streptomyces gilvosporeus]|uniref:hypothetical protein n=1 Tax=Streptomyces gilvosporeus TaxID=553510 RepID=UPI00131ACEF8|nr:hypothetical protein [Streptomyces gilvosporeus]